MARAIVVCGIRWIERDDGELPNWPEAVKSSRCSPTKAPLHQRELISARLLSVMRKSRRGVRGEFRKFTGAVQSTAPA
jgi:hypothetical protein